MKNTGTRQQSGAGKETTVRFFCSGRCAKEVIEEGYKPGTTRIISGVCFGDEGYGVPCGSMLEVAVSPSESE